MQADDDSVPATEARKRVDVSLIDAMLELTPEERLRHNDRMLRMIEELRDGVAAREGRSRHADR